MTTTRNPDLDTLSQGQSLGGAPLDVELGKVCLQFGITDADKGRIAKHAAFGLEHRISELKKGDCGT